MTLVDIYDSWLPKEYYYLGHLLFWMLPIVLLQWIFFFRILRRHLREIVLIPFLLGTYLIITDVFAVKWGIWFFDEDLILGINPLGVPIEEWTFFYLTVLLVVQSFVLFLPESLRRKNVS